MGYRVYIMGLIKKSPSGSYSAIAGHHMFTGAWGKKGVAVGHMSAKTGTSQLWHTSNKNVAIGGGVAAGATVGGVALYKHYHAQHAAAGYNTAATPRGDHTR